MTTEMTTCLGIDLTQNFTRVSLAKNKENITCENFIQIPPAVLLPVAKGESLIVGENASLHRRGVGNKWPPESQIPVNSKCANGVGRIPLVCAWVKLISLSNNNLGTTEIAWNPSGKHRLYTTAEKAITESTLFLKKQYDSVETVLVVPDSLGEAAQQVLIDNSDNLFLLPRTVAVAMPWCRKNAVQFIDNEILSRTNTSLGHLLVVTLSFDKWEIVPIEIQLRSYNDTNWLVPIHNRLGTGRELSRVGVNFFLALANQDDSPLEQIWKDVFGSSITNDSISENGHLTPEQIKSIQECFTRGKASNNQQLFHEIDGWEEIFDDCEQFAIESLKREFHRIYREQLDYLPESGSSKCLGLVIDGACSPILIASKRSVGDFIVQEIFNGDYGFSINNGGQAAKGAAIMAYALQHKLPSYREKLAPIEIHYHGLNQQGDYETAYKLLVEGKTVEAGSEYRSNTPVTGLKIKQGENKLSLTLRRSIERDSFYFRRVTAEIPKQTVRDEEVEIVAHLRPGQGFAKVRVDSVHRGVFSTTLDWRTMEPTEEPPPPPLAYLPEVSYIEADSGMWNLAQEYAEDAIYELQNIGGDLISALRDFREVGGLNKWPSADSIDDFRGVQTKGDIFRHYGICPSDGKIDTIKDSELIEGFALECSKQFLSSESTKSQKKAIQQAVSWLYLACPDVILSRVRDNLSRQIANTAAIDLHTIGLCWSHVDDFALFFEALYQRLLRGTIGVNNWLRACRNIIRFRDAALHPSSISKKKLNLIVRKIVTILTDQVDQNNFGGIFNNCILTSLYLLKRRRYDKDFLDIEDDLFYEIENVLDDLILNSSVHLNARNEKIIKITLKFLRKEASLTDLDSSVLTG